MVLILFLVVPATCCFCYIMYDVCVKLYNKSYSPYSLKIVKESYNFYDEFSDSEFNDINVPILNKNYT